MSIEKVILVVAGIIGGALGASAYHILKNKKKYEEVKNEGFKEGYAEASRNYEKKFREQATEFLNLIKEMEDELKEREMIADEAERLAEEAYRLLGVGLGVIKGLEEKNVTPRESTINLCDTLEEVTGEMAA